MKILFLGDSITQGAGASSPTYNYVSLVGKALACEVKNYGVGGTRIAKQKTPSQEAIYDEDFLTRAQRMEKEADMVFVFGGTNDYGHGDAEMGEEGSADSYTFIGAFETLISYLVGVYGKNKLHFILPLPRYNQESVYGEGAKKTALYPLRKYIENERKILQKWDIPYLDMSDIFPVPQSTSGDELTVDGLHPNDTGHALIAAKICTYVTLLS